MSRAGLAFQLHALIGMTLFALWPFTRLVHAFSAPVQYLFRPYIVYRSRDTGTAARRPRRGWEAVGPNVAHSGDPGAGRLKPTRRADDDVV